MAAPAVFAQQSLGVRLQLDKRSAIAELERKKKPLTQEAFVNTVRNAVPHLVIAYLAAGFDPNKPDRHGDSPMKVATLLDEPGILVELLEHSGEANDAAYFFNAIYTAGFTGSTAVIDVLVNAGCPIHFVDEETGLDGLGLARDMGNESVYGET